LTIKEKVLSIGIKQTLDEFGCAVLAISGQSLKGSSMGVPMDFVEYCSGPISFPHDMILNVSTV
jgi:hypothetical protein